MRRNQSSLTAQGIAIVRALESEKPEGERICYDPYARRFVDGWLYYLVKFFMLIGYANWRGPGVWEFLAARERYIDDFLQARLEEGVEQVVILGAGFDARAYRFEALKRWVKVFEVDHPATQAAKVKKVEAVFGSRPSYVTYVAIDFDQQAPLQRLCDSGYDERRVTLFIWQGVTQYLTPQAVDDTLAFVAKHSARGSSIIFDYMDPGLLAGAAGHGEISSMRRNRRLSGEMLVFGIPIAEVRAFLEQRGFTNVKNVDHAALEKLYFGGGPRKAADGYAIASGVVRAQ